MSRAWFAICFSAIALTGCVVSTAEQTTMLAPRTQAAVTYAGEIPCADCLGQRITLTLFPDLTFRLRQSYLGVENGGDRQVYDLGRWARTQDDGKHLRLRSGAESLRQFLFIRPDVIRMLDNEGREIRSAQNQDLILQTHVDRIEGPVRIRGMYMHQADAAVFNACLNGKRYSVLPEADHAALERAYVATRTASGTLVAVILTVRFVERQSEPGLPSREHVLVDKFERLLPGETCAPQAAGRAELVETYWRPVEINGKAVVIHPGTREPHMVLTRGANRVRGYTGCNTMAGVFSPGTDDGLRFEKLAVTRHACLPEEGMAMEFAFVKALEDTMSQRITGESLELRDATGAIRMRLEARYLR
jgi:copper homeostasis protein (lipoprotein)